MDSMPDDSTASDVESTSDAADSSYVESEPDAGKDCSCLHIRFTLSRYQPCSVRPGTVCTARWEMLMPREAAWMRALTLDLHKLVADEMICRRHQR